MGYAKTNKSSAKHDYQSYRGEIPTQQPDLRSGLRSICIRGASYGIGKKA